MRVAQIMTRKLITVSPDDSVERAVQLLQQRGVRHLLVLSDDELVGIISDRDIKRAMDPLRKQLERQVEIASGRRRLNGILHVPPGAEGVVAFAHGSGSGRFSPRNQFVAGGLQEAGLATLLLDLLEEDEAEDREKVFDIELLAERLQSAAAWLSREPATRSLRLGYFGASTGAGAALVAAARNPQAVRAVVSRGGRPDLAGTHLSAVRTPTLLIVGGNDDLVIELNRQAFSLLRCPKDLVVIPGATHLFEESGALEEVSRLAKEWFVRYLAPHRGSKGNNEFGPRYPHLDMDPEC